MNLFSVCSKPYSLQNGNRQSIMPALSFRELESSDEPEIPSSCSCIVMVRWSSRKFGVVLGQGSTTDVYRAHKFIGCLYIICEVTFNLDFLRFLFKLILLKFSTMKLMLSEFFEGRKTYFTQKMWTCMYVTPVWLHIWIN